MTDPVKCELCNFQCVNLKRLLNHLYSIHSQELNFKVKCSICAVQFTKYNSLYKHVVRQHKQHYELQQQPLKANDEVDNLNDDAEVNVNTDGGAPAGSPTPSLSDDNFSGSDDEVDNNDDVIVDEEEGDFDFLSRNQEPMADIKKACASFILKVKDRNNLSQVSLQSIMESTQHLSEVVIDSVKRDVLSLLQIHNCEKLDEVNDIFEKRPTLFEGLETLPLQRTFIEDNFDLLPFKEILLGKKLKYVKKGKKRQLAEAEDVFIYFPILGSVKQMLGNVKLRKVLLSEPNFSKQNFYSDLCDGRIYTEDQFFVEHPDALCLIIFHDEVEVCNPLGSKAGTHKLDMYYFTAANITPKYRSRHSAVRLIALVNSKHVKQYGYNKILEPIIEDLQSLYHGVEIEIGETTQTVFGKVLISTGDTLGQHLWGGFKEGVGVAFQKCRHCYCNFDEMQEKFNENNFQIRTKCLHNRDVDAIENAPNKMIKETLSLLYGVTSKSALISLPGFDITTQLPQDIMHTVAEGILQYELRLILLHYIKNKYFTLEQLNATIASFAYGYSEVSDKPSSLHDSVFTTKESYKLKYNAAQSRLFLRLVPFLLATLNEIDINSDIYTFLVDLIKIVQIIYAPTISLETIHNLKDYIEEHLKDFKRIFPDVNIIPKQHYLIHIPRMIMDLGPPIRSSCYSFEAAHKYFKRIAQKTNFKNVCLSIAQRYQRLLCADFGFENENTQTHPLFSSEIKYGVLTNLKEVEENELKHLLHQNSCLPGIELPKIYRLSWVSLYGTKYANGAYVIVSVNEASFLPVFGEIVGIWLIGPFIYFSYCKYDALNFSTRFQGYIVRSTNEIDVIPHERLVDYNVIHKRTIRENDYLQPKYDINDIMKQYISQ